MKKGPKDTLSVSNQILEQVLGYFATNSQQLRMEGILRIDGNVAQQKEVLERVKTNPSKKPITSKENLKTLGQDGKVKLELTHNIIGVLKKSLKDPLGFSPRAIEVVREFDKITPNDLVEELIKVDSFEEAKIIHNLLHLGFLVAKNQQANKMTPNNVAVVLTPQIANIAGEFNLGFSAVLQNNLTQLLDRALTAEKSLLSQPFDKEGYEVQMGSQSSMDTHSSESVSPPRSTTTTPTVARRDSRPRELQFKKSAEKDVSRGKDLFKKETPEEKVDAKWEFARYKDLNITDSSDISDIEDDNEPEDLEDVKPNPLVKKPGH